MVVEPHHRPAADYNKRIVTAAPNFYPPGPTVPEGFARPTAAYRRHAWTASTVLLLFVLMYLSLAGWFLLTAWRLGAAVVNGATEALIGGVSALFLAVFMLKGLFFVKRGSLGKGIEVTREEQPRLFEFLDRLAHEASAPRPRRVFLSAQVNACVFYDLSVLNLILPSRKNLEIGLGLVNVLSLGEFKAVCAHEFGHFAQRTMAVGRWVYVAQQIAVHIIAKRDALDDLLNWVSGIDVRVAWIGWILRLIVWSIRSLLESAFRLVVLAERALSRDMEMQADLVAVSLTGSGLPEARAAAAVIRVHARWDAADSPDILTWLSSAALGEPDAHILEARLKDNPGEVVSLRTQQDAAKGDGHSAICEHDAERARAAAGNADLQYLAARCNSTGEARDRAFVEGWQKWPGNGWFANAAGYALADHGAYDQALAALQVAWRNAPPVASSAAVLAARIRRMQARSVEADVRDLAAVSPELRDLLQTETGVDQAGPARAYASLGQGRLQEALAAAKGSPFENHVVRLVAASDGAPPDALQRVAALPAADNPYDTWIDGALALRRGLDFTPYQKAIRASLGDSGKALTPFVELVRTSQIPAANDQLKTLPLDLRLKASVFGTIALMERAPRDWRESAYYMLFPPERPYLRLESNSQGARTH